MTYEEFQRQLASGNIRQIPDDNGGMQWYQIQESPFPGMDPGLVAMPGFTPPTAPTALQFDNLGAGMNVPLTSGGQPVYASTMLGQNGGLDAQQFFYLGGDPNMPAGAGPAMAGGYSTDNGAGGFKDFWSEGLPFLAAATGAGLGLSALGAAGAAGVAPEAGSLYSGLTPSSVAPEVLGGGAGALDALGLSNAGTSAAGMSGWSLPAAIESGLLPSGAAGAGILGSLVAGAPGAAAPTTSAAAGSTGILSPSVTGAAGAGAATAAANALSNGGSLPDAGMDLGGFNDGNQYTSGLDQNALTQAAQQGAASSGVTNALTNGLTTGAASGLGGLTLSKLLSGNVGLNDLASLTTLGDLGKLGAAGLGYLGSQQQSEDYSNLARDLAAREDARYADLTKREEQRFNTLQGREDEAIARQRADIDYGRLVGAPSRDRYEASYAPTFNAGSLPGLQSAIDTSTQSLLRQLSTTGNPYGQPGGLAEVQNYITGNVILPELNRYRTLNAQTGGYGNYAGAGASIPGIGSSLPGNVGAGSSVGTQGGMQAAAGGIGASKGMYDSIGYGLNNLFGNGDSLTNTLRSLTNSGRLKLSLT